MPASITAAGSWLLSLHTFLFKKCYQSEMENIPVIDLFAGPGGLGEGFARHDVGDVRFDVRLSVEKDSTACATLRLRKFFRSFPSDQHRKAYYAYVQGIGAHPSNLFPTEWAAVKNSVLEWELGSDVLDQRDLERRIRDAIDRCPTWILVGGPPCQAYSLVGRSRMMGQDPEGFLRDHRHTLYLEYLKVLAKFRPPLFVMENVKGVLSSKLGDRTAFDQIQSDLQAPARASGKGTGPSYVILPIVQYRADTLPGTTPAPKDFIVRCEKHGIPQARHRVILVGIREDLARKAQLRPLDTSDPVATGSVIADLPWIRSRLSREKDSFAEWQSVVSAAAKLCLDQGIQTESLRSLARATGAKRDRELGARFMARKGKPQALSKWYIDPDLNGVLNHESRSHIRQDLLRYVFVAAYAEFHHRSPSLKHFPTFLLPEHKNAKPASSAHAVPFADRFRVQRKEVPATTVTSHISRDGHYFIHFDITQCRSLSVREAARLQTFPDNYFFEGNRTQQYHQVGNAVPPFLANQIAGRVAEFIAATRKVNE